MNVFGDVGAVAELVGCDSLTVVFRFVSRSALFPLLNGAGA